jgi:16S rRNA (cytosine1402-N4)-methyltransferase
MSVYHVPVMLKESLEGMALKADGVYVDLTFGGGGHSREILKCLGEEGRLYGFDQDPDAAINLLNDKRFTFIPSNFRYMSNMLRLEGVRQVDGILADLGLSSFQIDEVSRGFMHRETASLDMRMSKTGELDAGRILNTYSETELTEIFSRYGEVRNSKTLAREIIKERQRAPFKTNDQLTLLLERIALGEKHRYFSQVFQALRIEVNQEFEALKEMLEMAKLVLKPGGRLVVLTYHSLEDKLVKNYIKSGTFDGSHIQDDFGRIERPFKVITKKPILPGAAELRNNSRSRSAKLRIAEKI